MRLIIVNDQRGPSFSLMLRGWGRVLALSLLGLPMLVGAALGYQLGRDRMATVVIDSNAGDLARARAEAEASEQKLQAMARKLAELQAKVLRLDAIGETLVRQNDLDETVFDFNSRPGVGGNTDPQAYIYSPPDVMAQIDALARQVDHREQQMEALEGMLLDVAHDTGFKPALPVRQGWVSSGFGTRIDPFTGHRAFHKGIDFDGNPGDPILAVADGVVVNAGRDGEYGNQVEVRHAGGYTTRYAHNKANLVKVGDVIKKGQVIALLGSTGRSTGYHLHFEIYRQGRVIDPATYVRRTGS